MSIRRLAAVAASVAALSVMAAGIASAQLVGIANAGGNNPSAGNFITYTPGTGNGFSLFTNNGHITDTLLGQTSPVTINFGTLTNIPGSYIPPDPSTGAFSQGLNGGTFSITQGSTVLLSGTFGASTLSGTDTSLQPTGAPGSSPSGSVTLVANSLTYTGGTYFDATHFSPNNGSLSIGFNASGPIVASATQVNDFVANDVITFDALPLGTTVPEPASLAGLGIGFLFLVGLAFVAKRRSSARAA
jgi:hypothetical protein